MAGVLLIPARNASSWTGPTGNNTYLLTGAVPTLIDAGVGHPEHIDEIARALAGAPLAQVLITHGHVDHVSGLPALLARWPHLQKGQKGTGTFAPHLRKGTGTFAEKRQPPLAGGSAEQVVDDQGLRSKIREIRAGDTVLDIVGTPGHSPDHVCFFERQSGDLFCGDLLRAEGTIVIPATKGGDMRQYLQSLRTVRALRPKRLLPGHGRIIDDPEEAIDRNLRHRAEREQQILEARATGARTAAEIVARVYAKLPAALQPAAEDTVRAHLAALGIAEGEP